MKIPFEVWITVETINSQNCTKLCVSLNHDLTKEDLEEFAESQGYDSVESYFKNYINDDEEELETVLTDYKNDNCLLVESDIEIYCGDKNALENFLHHKYEDEVLSKFCENLSYNEELNNLE